MSVLLALFAIVSQPDHCPEPFIYHEDGDEWVCAYQGDGSYSWIVIPEIEVESGWNLIGSTDPSVPEGIAFASECDSVHIAMYRDELWYMWNSQAETLSDDFMVEPGDAYWLHCS